MDKSYFKCILNTKLIAIPIGIIATMGDTGAATALSASYWDEVQKCIDSINSKNIPENSPTELNVGEIDEYNTIVTGEL